MESQPEHEIVRLGMDGRIHGRTGAWWWLACVTYNNSIMIDFRLTGEGMGEAMSDMT